jgi:carboxymethylenebutenolidase
MASGSKTMCHTNKIEFFGDEISPEPFADCVEGLCYPGTESNRKIAILPDIYGLTDFYKGYSSYIASQGATAYLVNPWAPFGELPELTREAAYERRHKLRDREHCDDLERFLAAAEIDTIIGFCIGGNFAFELARRGYRGTIIAIYPLPWGMANDDAIVPAFDYMPSLDTEMTILMGGSDQLAGPDNVTRLQDIVSKNNKLTLHLYPGSNHGFFTDVDGSDIALKENAMSGIATVNETVYPAA